MAMTNAPALPMILVVEDDPTTRLVVMRVLTADSRFTVIGVGSVAEAQTLISVETPQIVILDMELPDGTGLDVLDIINRGGLATRIVVLSAHVSEFPALKDSGGITVLSKPMKPAELRAVLDEELANSQRDEPSTYAFSISEYLQIACLGRHSVTIDVSSEGRSIGAIQVWTGDLFTATDEQSEGCAAFYRLFATPDTELAVRPLTETPQRSITDHWEHMLFEAAKRSDENDGSPAKEDVADPVYVSPID